MRVAVSQLKPGPDYGANVDVTVASIRKAAGAGASLVVLPELCTSPYQLESEALSFWASEIPQGPIVQLWRHEAVRLRIAVVAGLLEKCQNDIFYNSAVIIGPDGSVSTYRKTHLFGWERGPLTQGAHASTVVRVGDVKLGPLICYDLRFPEAVGSLVREGVQLLCVPTTWTDIGKPIPWDQYGLCGAAHMAIGTAYARRLFVLCADRIGTENGVRYLGNSVIAGPTGLSLAGPAPKDESVLLVADIDPTEADDKRIGAASSLIHDTREDLYRDNTGNTLAPI
jgi:predicted amidohydrolase